MMDTALFSPLLFPTQPPPPVLPLSGNLDAVCNVCCSRRLKLNEWYNQRCWDYRGQNWCYLSNDVLFCGSEATNRREKWSPHSVWFYSLSGERQIEQQWCGSRGCKWLNNFPRFRRSFVFSTVFLRGFAWELKCYLSLDSAHNRSISQLSTHLQRWDRLHPVPTPLIGSAQKRVRGKLMTPAMDASSWKPKLRPSRGWACGNKCVLLFDSAGCARVRH